jgi:hypothetical protein
MADFSEQYWARLSPAFRRAHNKLLIARGLPPIPDPKVDQYVPPRGMVRSIDPADPEAVAAAAEFGREIDNNPPDAAFLDWVETRAGLEGGIAKQLALKLARYQLADRQLHTETLHRAIAQFVVIAMKESGWPRKRIIFEAERIYGLKARAIETAIQELPQACHFTEGDKLSPVAVAFRDLPIELRLQALGLPLAVTAVK